MGLLADDPADRAEQLTLLTDRLIGLIDQETALTAAGRWADARPVVEEKGKLAAVYQLELRRISQDRSLLSGAPVAARALLVAATDRLRDALDRHARAIERARLLAEGLVHAIAAEAMAHRAAPIGYGPGAQAAGGAIALDVRG